MTNLLLHLFVKDADNTENPKVRAAIGTLSGLVGIVCNLLLFTFKLLVGTLTCSVSITADAMNNLSAASGSSSISLNTRSAAASADCSSLKIFAASLMGPENFLEYSTKEEISPTLIPFDKH